MTVPGRTIQRISWVSAGQIVHGIIDAYLGRSRAKQKEKLETMGTELLTVATTVLLFGLCALFVRICDRI